MLLIPKLEFIFLGYIVRKVSREFKTDKTLYPREESETKEYPT